MLASLRRALIGALAGALAGMASVAVVFSGSASILLEMDRDLPPLASGFYAVERHDRQTFAWTSSRAELTLPGLDRRVPWSCTVRVRGARAAGLPQPAIGLAIDGIALGRHAAPADYQDLVVTAPERPSRSGLTLTITTSPTFVPGPSDPRELGVQIDRLACRPAGLALPPGRVLAAGAVSAASFGAAFGVMGLGLWTILATVVSLAIAMALPLSRDLAPYGVYPSTVVRTALWTGVLTSLAALVVHWWRRDPMRRAACAAIAVSGSLLFLELIVLFHPAKPLVDALFHAHRFEWVLDGRYYFTQTMPDGVRFPYAIALYLVAAPWSLLTGDHVALLRVVVCAARAVAGVLLYLVVVRVWKDRLAGLVAVVLFHAAPLSYLIIGFANLTFAFGQSAALVAFAAAAVLPLRPRDAGQFAVLFALASLAFLSHVGVFPVLLTTLLAAAFLYWWLGGGALRAPAAALFAVAILAAVFSVVAYYGHFREAYETLDRVRAKAASVTGSARATDTDSAPAEPSAGQPAGRTPPRPVRLLNGLARTVRAVGWPLVLLAAVGAWSLWKAGARDRLTLMLAGGGIAYAVFLAFAVLAPVEARFLRYNDEFIDRVSALAIPIAAILAAKGFAWAWRGRGPAFRIPATLLAVAASFLAARQWLGWLS